MAVVTDEQRLANGLTDSDLKLIKLLCLPNKVISGHLGMDRFAVGMQIKRISTKLKVENRTSIVVRALELGLVNFDQLVYRSDNGGTDLH